MSTQITVKDFETIYEKTYDTTLKYIVCKCSNIEDVNDLIQDTYTELCRRRKSIKNRKDRDYYMPI